MLRKRFIFQTLLARMNMWSDYSNVFIILVFLDALRTPNYSSEELLIKSGKFRQVYINITSTFIGLISLLNGIIVHVPQLL